MNERLRILHLTDFYPPLLGGVELQVRQLARSQAEAGHAVSVATMAVPGAAREEWDERVQVHRVPTTLGVLPHSHASSSRPYHPTAPDPRVTRRLAAIVREVAIDVVHAHSWMVHSYLPVRRSNWAPVVIWMHDYSMICPRMTFLHQGSRCTGGRLGKCTTCSTEQYGRGKAAAMASGARLMRSYVRRSRLVGNSRLVAQAVETDLRLAPGSVPVVFPSVSAQAYERPKARPSCVPAREDYLLFVGALGGHKGLNVLLEAYNRLSSPPPLVLLGTRQADTPRSLPDGVRMKVDVPHADVLAASANCLFGILPSTVQETFGVAAAEAAAAGRPVIASDIGGLPEVVSNGETGILVPPGDVEALCEAMKNLLFDRSAVESLGAQARLNAQRWNPVLTTERFDEVYARLLNVSDRKVRR